MTRDFILDMLQPATRTAGSGLPSPCKALASATACAGEGHTRAHPWLNVEGVCKEFQLRPRDKRVLLGGVPDQEEPQGRPGQRQDTAAPENPPPAEKLHHPPRGSQRHQTAAGYTCSGRRRPVCSGLYFLKQSILDHTRAALPDITQMNAKVFRDENKGNEATR